MCYNISYKNWSNQVDLLGKRHHTNSLKNGIIISVLHAHTHDVRAAHHGWADGD